MWNLEKAIIITNNDRVYSKYKNEIQCILLENYEDVLIKVRDMVYDRHILLTHPQASSLKPNQTPYRSIIVYPDKNAENIKDILLIEKCLEVFRAWQDIALTPKKYESRVSEDFKTIDLSIIENLVPCIY